MKKPILIIGILLFSLALLSQEIFIEQSLVVNIEVPVRVFDGGKFVEDLNIKDFEVYEDGKPQKVVAVYMIKKAQIERKEEKKIFTPETSRNFYLFFQLTEYSPKIEKALQYFMQNVLVPGDKLVVVTSMKTYKMKEIALEMKSREEIVKELRGLIRKDAMMGSAEYRASLIELSKITQILTSVIAEKGGDEDRARIKMDDLTGMSNELIEFTKSGNDIDDVIQILVSMYASVLEKLEQSRYVDQYRLLDFAKFLKEKKGQKYVFLFYQKEFIPQIETGLLVQSLGAFQDQQHVALSLSNLMHMYRKEIPVDIDKVNQAYADSSASIHFMFFTKPAKHITGVQFIERSEDIFAAFREMAVATGGTTESSSNPGFLFKKAVESSENYYLLYYSPEKYMSDGEFKKIKVVVRGKNYRILHRAGYFAN